MVLTLSDSLIYLLYSQYLLPFILYFTSHIYIKIQQKFQPLFNGHHQYYVDDKKFKKLSSITYCYDRAIMKKSYIFVRHLYAGVNKPVFLFIDSALILISKMPNNISCTVLAGVQSTHAYIHTDELVVCLSTNGKCTCLAM